MVAVSLTLLTMTFVVLKSLGHLDWSWIWVFAPLWIPFALILILLAVLVSWASILDWFEEPWFRR